MSSPEGLDYLGRADIALAASQLSARLPKALSGLGPVAFNYRWSWTRSGGDVFSLIDPIRWDRCEHNPVRLLLEASEASLDRAANDVALVAAAEELCRDVADGTCPRAPHFGSWAHPIAFLCAEFGVHGSLPIYSGGLGVLAGDILKEASDLGLPMIGVGLLYRTGYFHQRLDTSGYQHEYWVDSDPDRLPMALVRDANGEPVRVWVPVEDEDVAVQAWRVDVGRVPLYLLDTDVPENSVVARWITSRLYEGNSEMRLAQYAVLGVGATRLLRACGIEPSLYHLNEGHAALATLDLVAELQRSGMPADEAWNAVRAQVVFTTHTPVAAGNETYPADKFLRMLGRIGDLTGDRASLLSLGRAPGEAETAWSGLSPLALRSSRSMNAVSARHEQVAREMWKPFWPERAAADVPISHVTNGVHAATWLSSPMRALLDRHLDAGWMDRTDDPTTWAPVSAIDAEEVWAARSEARRRLIDVVRLRSTEDRLRRGEELSYAEAAEWGFDPETLTIGFARRIASYKRLHLLGLDPSRATALLSGPRPIQVLLAGKAHPRDEGAKSVVRSLFELKSEPSVGGRVAFLEDYDLALAAELVAGCDVWVNLPRPPLEASGTSGMKAALNGCINLSVLDGWWAEAFDGMNGWAIGGEVSDDEAAQDRQDAAALFELLETEVIPLFYDRGPDGVPHAWVEMVKRSLITVGSRFTARRMLGDYVAHIYTDGR